MSVRRCQRITAFELVAIPRSSPGGRVERDDVGAVAVVASVTELHSRDLALLGVTDDSQGTRAVLMGEDGYERGPKVA